MKLRNKIIALILLLSLIFTSKAFVAFAENESTTVATEETKIEEETKEETEIIEDAETKKKELEIIEEPESEEEIEPEEETASVEETEPEEETEKAEETETEEESEEAVETEAEEKTEKVEETEVTEETKITEETETTQEIESIEKIRDDKLLGASDPKFRFAYFKEDMSIGLYTFDYVGFSVIPDSVSIAANQLKDLVYTEKRYNGAVDLGFENYNIGWLEENYKWDDSRIYSESPMSLSDAYRNWCTGSTIEDELYCANYAKLSEMTIVKNTIDTEYYIGERFNPDGLKVDVKFANNKTATIEYSESTKSHFKFYDNDTGAEYTVDTDVNADFTLKIVYGDVEHGSSAISTVSVTIDIVTLDPAGEKGFRVYCQKLDDTMECIDYVNGTSAGEFTETIRQFINGEEVASDMVAYQGFYFLNTYGGTDYEAYRTWNATDVFSFESEFENKVDEWISNGKIENKSVGIILQRRKRGDESGIIYFWHFKVDGTVVYDTYTEIDRMEVFDELINVLDNGIPPQYNSITGYYKDEWIDYQFYRPDRRPEEEYTGIRGLIIDWKERANSFNKAARRVCIAYERKTPDSISVSTKPSKVNYQTGERFNPDGLEITASYPGNINDIIPCDSFRKYLFSFDPTTDTDLSNANDKVTITCCGASVDLPIYVEPVVDSISMNKTPNYVTYSVGEKLDVSGLSINVDYVGAASRGVEYNNETKSAFTFNPNLNYTYETSDIGVKTYTLTYREKQTTFDINVLENNKFVVHSDDAGNIHSEVLEAGDSGIESVLDAAIHDNFTGFYKIDASGYYDSQKKYDKTTIQTLTRAQVLELFNTFSGTENVFIGAAVKAPAPPKPPKPPRPYNPSGGGGSSGGGGGSSVAPMNNLAQTPLEQQKQDEKLNTTNSIPQSNLVVNAQLAILLLKYSVNEEISKINVEDSNGNKGFGKWLNVPDSNNWLFLAGDLAANGTLGTAGFAANGLYNLSWGTTSGWYGFDSNGMMLTGWQQINGRRYYFEPSPSATNFGVAAVGFKMIKGEVYRFDTNGVLMN